MTSWYCTVTALIAVFLVLPTWIRLTLADRRARREHDQAVAEGRHEPVTILPWVDRTKCMGSGACVTACPEKVLRVVDGQVAVVNAAACVGHGACVAACPVSSLTLHFGSDRRGVEIPEVRPNFQTNVPGLFVAGELGGMGLVANAFDQGQQAVRNALKGVSTTEGVVDVVIVGAGPAGISAAATARSLGASYALLEQEEFGGAIRHFPRQKLVMTRPFDVPGYGRVERREASKEELVALFQDVIGKAGLQVDAPERVDAVARGDDGVFTVTTSRRVLRAARVILTVGRRGTPRRMDVPGEDQEKVTYRLVDPELYQDQHLLVVGGGDSAVEAAVSLGEQPGNTVTLVYRGKVIDRPKAANRARLKAAEDAGKVRVMLQTNPVRVDLDRVELDAAGERVVIANDFVFVLIGGVLPTAFLQAAGVDIHTHYGKRIVSGSPDRGSASPR